MNETQSQLDRIEGRQKQLKALITAATCFIIGALFTPHINGFAEGMLVLILIVEGVIATSLFTSVGHDGYNRRFWKRLGIDFPNETVVKP